MNKISILRTIAVAAVALVCIAGWFIFDNSERFDRQAGLIFLFGISFGVILQRSRFCFFCILRDFFEHKNGRPLIGILTALLVGSVGYLILFGSWVSDPTTGYIPQDAHIGPAGWHLLLGGLTFGWGMALSGSCISAHFYRLGEGSVTSPFALIGTAGGFILGFMAWNRLYTLAIADATVAWFPEITGGYSLSFLLQASLLIGGILWLLIYFSPAGKETTFPNPSSIPTLASISNRVFKERWPSWAGGIGVGLLGTFYFFRVEPLGVTAEINRLSRAAGHSLGTVPEQLRGLDSLAGCIIPDGAILLSTNGILIVGLVAGALLAGVIAGKFKPKAVPLTKILKSLLGGVLLGFGAMISLGCTIGTTLSGIMAFAASGWIFTLAMVFGVWSGIKWSWHR